MERLSERRTPRAIALQIFVVLGAPFAWVSDFMLSYAITQHACSTGKYWQLHLSWMFFLTIALIAAVLAFRMMRDLQPVAGQEHGSPADRSYFAAILGLMSSIFFALALVASAVPRFILSPCD